MLEEMASFFEKRLEGYDQHMLSNIESAQIFYPFTADQLPKTDGASLLDLGCGTGLELDFYLKLNHSAKVTGIDLSKGMLDALKAKFEGGDMTLIQGSYFDVPLGCEQFDAAVSVESLHHFTKAEKIPLYQKLHAALKQNGFFILTDYFSADEAEEQFFRSELLRQKQALGLDDDCFYHYDTPLTVDNEKEALFSAGFSDVIELASWGATHTLKAIK